ncbi:hypothetical protein CCAX7_65150 [Capsulimonas corticalis]|uniref:Uncharacterized protein n=1 Tax=Capsulimonas corticalis TaxID=2219043 RepID=A0A402CQX4_9BACT|nr:hypothetical protein [Capsulimonas corticalis]BDI34464.1 hypothetical protein CCAX7_65150 [Capsulimonas corticalis]
MNGLAWSALRAMFWKECRENAKWALLASVALTVAMAVVTTQPSSGFPFIAPKSFADFWTSADHAILFGSMLTALLLGFLQILPEQRRDQWEFLRHRPVAPAVLFWGKACAGLTLYLAACAFPLLAVSAWAAAPGGMAAPFDPRLMLAGCAAIACGAGVYFAALTSALCAGRWAGVRVLPLCAGAAAAYLNYSAIPEFWQSLAASTLASALLAAAACSCFLSGESPKPMSARPALALTCILGCAALGAIGCAAMGWRGELSRREEDPGVLPASGRIVRATYAPSEQRVDASVVSAVPDLKDDLGAATAKAAGAPRFPQITLTGDWQSARNDRFTSPQRYVQPIAIDPFADSTRSCVFYAALRRRIEVYSAATRRVTAQIDVGDARPGGSCATGPFPGRLVGVTGGLNGEMLLVFSRQIYRLSAPPAGGAVLSRSWRVTPLLRRPLDEDIVSAASSRSLGPGLHRGVYFVAFASSVQVVSEAGDMLVSQPTERGEAVEATVVPGARGAAERGGDSDRYILCAWPSQSGDAGIRTRAMLEFSSSGALLRRTRYSWAAAPVGAPWRAAGPCVIVALSVLLAIAAVAGSPARVSCPKCRKGRIVTEDLCAHCGAAFPSAPRDGTEVFARRGFAEYVEAR